MKKNSELLIGLLVGGSSSERKVSKSSSKSIYKALIELGYKVVLIDPAYGKTQPKNPEDFFAEKDLFEVSTKNYLDAIGLEVLSNVDLVFNGLHGKWGEDGSIQSMLDTRGLKYTGSGVLASAISMDKKMAKIIFESHGVPVAQDIVLHKKTYDFNSTVKDIEKSFGFPVVVKPNDEGSSVAVEYCENKETLAAALEASFQYSHKVLIEQFILGRELQVGVLEDFALPVLEIKPKHILYDYTCKYEKGNSEYFVPAHIPQSVAMELQRLALITFNSIGCKGYVRTDFKLTSENKIYCLEINTLPGMTGTSLIPKMANAVGISFNELIDKIVKFSL